MIVRVICAKLLCGQMGSRNQSLDSINSSSSELLVRDELLLSDARTVFASVHDAQHHAGQVLKSTLNKW